MNKTQGNEKSRGSCCLDRHQVAAAKAIRDYELLIKEKEMKEKKLKGELKK